MRKRKQVYSVTLFAEVAERLRDLGGTLSGGIARAQELLETGGVMQSAIEERHVHERRVATALLAGAAAQTQDARTARAEQDLMQERLNANVARHWCAENAFNFEHGHPLLDMSRAPPKLRDAVYTDAVEKYGWESGPRPAGLVSPADPKPRLRAGAVPRQNEASTDYDSVFGDTPPQASGERPARPATQDCWRCAAPVPVDHFGACPICDALTPHGGPVSGESMTPGESADVEGELMNAGSLALGDTPAHPAEAQHEAQGSAFTPPREPGAPLGAGGSWLDSLPAYAGTLAENETQARAAGVDLQESDTPEPDDEHSDASNPAGADGLAEPSF